MSDSTPTTAVHFEGSTTTEPTDVPEGAPLERGGFLHRLVALLNERHTGNIKDVDVVARLNQIVMDELHRRDGEHRATATKTEIDSVLGSLGAAGAVLNVLAGIEAHLERIGNNTTRATQHVTIEQVQDAWEAAGIRVYPELAVPFLKALGVEVDE